MIKRITTIILSLLITLSAFVSVSAATQPAAPVGDKVVISDANWAYEKVNTYGWEIDEYVGESATPSVPYSFAKEYVTTIGSRAFSSNTAVTSVTLTPVIESIGEYAFSGCTSLEAVMLYSSTTKIDVGCFYGDTSLRNINLQDTSITEVSAYCFAECGITELELPETCESIGNMAFYNSTGLSKLTIPDSVTQIADTAFLNCDSLVIYGTKDSYAIEYAQAHDIDYVITDPEPVTVTFLLGDTDGDEDVTIRDATIIQRILAEMIDDTDGIMSLRGDVRQDGLDIDDVTMIQRFLVGLSSGYPIGEEITRTLP